MNYDEYMTALMQEQQQQQQAEEDPVEGGVPPADDEAGSTTTWILLGVGSAVAVVLLGWAVHAVSTGRDPSQDALSDEEAGEVPYRVHRET